jgi:hypothetical protein
MFRCQRWTTPHRGVDVLLKDVFESRTSQRLAAGIDKELRHGNGATHGQPRAQRRDGLLPQRQTTFAASLAVDENAGLRLKRQVFEPKTGEFGHAQAGGLFHLCNQAPFQSISCRRSCTMSPVRNPRRASKRRIALSRLPTGEDTSQESIRRSTASGGRYRGRELNRQWATTGMAPSRPARHRFSRSESAETSAAPSCTAWP